MNFFSKKIEKYIKSQEYKANSVNIMDMYIQLYNKTKTNNFIYNKETIKKSIILSI